MHFLLAILIIPQAFAQQPARKELVDRRTYNSKTYYNPEDNTFTAEISTGYLHYRTADGAWLDINTDLQPNANGSRIDDNLYRVRFRGGPQELPYDVAFELPRPVDLAADHPGRKPVSSTLNWKILSLGYFDRTGKQYAMIGNAGRSSAEVAGNVLTYPDIFPGVDARFEFGATRLKEEFVLSQKARDDLPDPQDFGILRSNAYLMVQFEFNLALGNMQVFARSDGETRVPVKQGNRFTP